MTHRFMILMGIGLILMVQFGCIGLKTFPYTAQAGDTVTLGGGLDLGLKNELLNRSNATVTLTKDGDPAFGTRDLTAAVRSIFQLYPDPRSEIWNYNMFLGPLSEGRPFETGVAVDLPTDLVPGLYTLHLTSPVLFNDWNPLLQIIDDPAVAGEANCFQDQSGFCNDIKALERQGYVRVGFNAGVQVGAMEIVLDLNSRSNVAAKDINVISPRINYGSAGFGTTNRDHLRMFYWRPDANTITVHYICPNGVDTKFMFFDVVYPTGQTVPIDVAGATVTAYDVNGADISTSVTATLDSY